MRTQTRTSLALGGAFVFVLALAGCANEPDDLDAEFAGVEAVTETFAFTGHTLNIDSGTSDLKIVVGGADEITVERRIAGVANGEAPEATQTLAGDALRLAVDCNGLALSCEGEFTVTVPSGVEVVAQNKNATITVNGFSESLTVSAVNGEAELANISGTNLLLSGKDMDVEGTAIAAQIVVAEARNGDIELAFSKEPSLVEVTNNDGDVNIALPAADYKVNAVTKKGDAEITVSQSDSSVLEINVTTRNGDIEIVPAK